MFGSDKPAKDALGRKKQVDPQESQARVVEVATLRTR
jgi:hypothetical protein